MRTYILALTKYGLAGIVLIYTAIAWYLLFAKKKQEQIFGFIQSFLMLAFQLIAYVTLALAMMDGRYILFCLVQLITFFAATLLYRLLYRNAHMPLFNNMCFLLSVGLVMISRLDFAKAWRQFLVVIVGLVVAVALPALRGQFHLLKKPRYYYAIFDIAMLAIVMLLGSSTLGAKLSWSIGGLTFQPSEFIKIIYILFLASTLKDAKSLRDLVLVAIFAGAHVLILIGSTDLGSGLIFYIVFLFMAFFATDLWYILAVGFGALGLGSVVMYHMFEHVRQRLQAYLDPWSVIDGIGYQITQALFAISAGGAWGAGLGQGTPDKVFFADTDFIFASCCEEYGLIVAICIILITLNCFFIMLKLSAGFADKFYQLVAYGCAVTYGFQAFLTIGGQTKFIPLTGVTLPLVAYGGSSVLSTLLMFTIVQTMYIIRGDKIDELRQKRHQQAAQEYYRQDYLDAPDGYRRRQAGGFTKPVYRSNAGYGRRY